MILSMRALLIILLALGPKAMAVNQPELLPPEQAFIMQSEIRDGHAVLRWQVAPGYFLYRHRFGFALDGTEVDLESVNIPRGERKLDEIFGDVEALRDQFEFRVPLPVRFDMDRSLVVTYQGCADIGVCYPPQTTTVELKAVAQSSSSGLESLMASLGGSHDQAAFLPPDQAFVLSARTDTTGRPVVQWNIIDGYYLYRSKFSATVVEPVGVEVLAIDSTPGIRTEDEYFGEVEVIYGVAQAALVLNTAVEDPLVVEVVYQGCADAGLCYPPQTRRVHFAMGQATPGGIDNGSVNTEASLSQQDRIAQALRSDSLLWSLLAFFGFGLLLSFTPCVLPMIPILSSIIVGQGAEVSTRRAFSLSAVYVLAMALTYSAAGVAAGLLGGGIQAAFQNPTVLFGFALVFLALSGAMFGFYELAVPASLQTRLSGYSGGRKGGTTLGVAGMGALSALIVGPCVAAPLAGALIYIGQTGDAVLGGLALFTMSLGMGVPLLIIGTSAGRLLPRAGPWMEGVKRLFGYVLLGVAIYLLSRVVDAQVHMLLWAALLAGFAVHQGVLRGAGRGLGWRGRSGRAAGFLSAIYAVLIVGATVQGGTDPLRPWHALAGAEHQGLVFKQVPDIDAVNAEIALANAAGKSVMLDYYADWCVSCKEMEKYTFSDGNVVAALADTVLLQVDVTRNTPADKMLLETFGLYGPPAILFFSQRGEEQIAFRLVGFVAAEPFITHVQRAVR